MTATADPVDERLPILKLAALGMQHVLVMYAGAIAVPLIVGGALNLPKSEIAFLISADLFCCGLVTIIQSLGIWRFGIRMPVMMGVTFAAVGPMVAIANNPSLTILHIFGSGLVGGVFCILVAPYMSRLMRYFPPVVTGTVITVIGISLMSVGINWAAGGQPIIGKLVNGVFVKMPNPDYGSPLALGIAALVLVSILLIIKYVKGFIANISVLMGMVIGFLVALAMGKINFDGLGATAWFDWVMPFHYGWPQFDIPSILSMCLVMIVTMIESTGMFVALGDIVGKKVDHKILADGLRVDGLGTVLGGILNTFPHTSFSQNVGLVGVTGVRSRYVCVAAGVILVIFGLFPKMAHLAASIPQFVLGGAGIVMFGMVAATGIKILSKVNFNTNSHNLFIVAVSIGAGMIPLVAPTFFAQMPSVLSTIFHSGILLASFMAVVLNLFFNGSGAREESTDFALAAAEH
ncbi:NCS2 family nucleobase:cation symporter-2 [Herbaspirillum sp. Sphag1AN]|uniref:nucleobase:cation symporter-2 family protein n=1 Tax=unclassified Herbaspirillum TaxID=2624150 RepID=UPI00160D37D9|nr:MULTISPECIES: nucleobase:cation symporter-2 family protein [unclassified Herbaspirillum]MBB3211224.1 NCS2 family nucleobase:cation symporter-2 [Herbaspirillum sp. Sphag1AN]MBB3244853.1 NCS2 family nucleobase:cation symporter-2 [Herbaspirillum sp. Sphag64]